MRRMLAVCITLVMVLAFSAFAGPFVSGNFEDGLIDLSVGAEFELFIVELSIANIATQTAAVVVGPSVDLRFAALLEREAVDAEFGVEFQFAPFVVYPFTFALDGILLWVDGVVDLADLFETAWTVDLTFGAKLLLDDTFVSTLTYNVGFYIEMPWAAPVSSE